MARDKKEAEQFEIIREETVTQDTVNQFVTDFKALRMKYLGEICEAQEKPVQVTKMFRGKPVIDEKSQKPVMVLSHTASEALRIFNKVIHSIVKPFAEKKALDEAKAAGKKLCYTME